MIALSPWLAFFWHSKSYDSGDDGPAAMFLMVITAIGALFALTLYSFSIYLNRFLHSKRFVRWIIVLPMGVVMLYCLCTSFFWVKVGADGVFMFLFTALGYAALAIKMCRQINWIIRVNP
ncbi:hypothetical protein D3C76_1369000 [compost metagenome]